MAENATTVPPKGLGTIKISDFWKGALMAFGTSLLGGIYFLLTKDHFPTWAEFQPYLQAAIAAFIMYILKNLGTNNVGQLLTKDKPVVHVDVETLNDLKYKASGGDVPPNPPPHP